jgi:hypothetical protein
VRCENSTDTPARKAIKDRTEMKKKLVEVAVPLESIKKGSAREKSIRRAYTLTVRVRTGRLSLVTDRV